MGNWIWGIVLAVVVLVATLSTNFIGHQQKLERDNYAQSVSGNMLVYRNSVIDYARAHPEASGEIAEASLALPTWFRRDQDVKNYVTGGQGYVYYASGKNGEASELLRTSKGDALVGIKRGGLLYNPSLGVLALTLPAAIPESAVVVAPSAASTATPPPAEPETPAFANCQVPAGTLRKWTVAGETCVAYPATDQTVPHLGVLGFNDADAPATGSASYQCNDGVLSTTPESGASCAAPPPVVNCSVPAGTTRSWTVSGVTCQGPAGPATVSDGAALTVVSTNGNTGSADFVCNSSTLSTTAKVMTKTCTKPASPCALPTPSTETQSETRTETQTLGCPAGYTGSITQTQPQQRTQSRTAYCPAPTGAYSWGAWSAWSDWSATGPWTTTNNTCVPQTCTGPSSQTQWVSASAACPSGQVGSNTWEKEQKQTRTCSLGTWGSWSSWVDTGNTRNNNNTCAAVTYPTVNARGVGQGTSSMAGGGVIGWYIPCASWTASWPDFNGCVALNWKSDQSSLASEYYDSHTAYNFNRAGTLTQNVKACLNKLNSSYRSGSDYGNYPYVLWHSPTGSVWNIDYYYVSFSWPAECSCASLNNASVVSLGLYANVPWSDSEGSTVLMKEFSCP